jgi:hypothetical protein
MTVATLRTPTEWASLLGIHILDPDGWRGTMRKDFGEPITAREFDQRVWKCTIRCDKPELPKAVDLVKGGAA